MCIVLMGYLRFTPVVMAIVVCVVVAGKRVSGWVYILFFGQSGGVPLKNIKYLPYISPAYKN